MATSSDLIDALREQGFTPTDLADFLEELLGKDSVADPGDSPDSYNDGWVDGSNYRAKATRARLHQLYGGQA